MADYTYNDVFAGKDALPPGSPGKVVKATEFDTEFNAIETAVNSKANSNDSALTGSATAANLTVNGLFTSVGIDDNATSTAITIDAIENVGIGTVIPDTELHVSGNVAGLTSITLENIASSNSGAGSEIAFKQGANGYDAGKIVCDRIGSYSTTTSSQDSAMLFYTAADGVDTEAMRIDAAGNVGIGTTSPTNALQIGDATEANKIINIASTSNGYLTFGDAADNDIGLIQYNHPSNFMSFGTNTAERMRIDASGNVGIGRTSPATRLEVADASDAAIRVRAEGTGARVTDFIQAADGGFSIQPQNGQPIDLWTAGSSRLHIDAAGNVGIGTTNPTGSKLHIYTGASSSNDLTAIRFENSGESGTALDFYNAFGPQAQLKSTKAGSGASSDEGVLVFSTATNSVLSEAMRIDASGNVGIGETSPDAPLHISNIVPEIIMERVDPAIVTGNQISSLSTVAGETTPDEVASIKVYATSNWSGASSPSDMAFFTTPSGALSNAERMRIDSAGNLLVGKTSAAVTGAGLWALPQGRINYTTSANGGIVCGFYSPSGGSAAVGSIVANAASTAYNTTSDYRLKENVTPIDNALARVALLKPSRFNFIADKDKTVDGFIAHEAQAVVPEAVTGEKDGEEMQGIDQSKLVPLLTAAIQELTARLEALEGN